MSTSTTTERGSALTYRVYVVELDSPRTFYVGSTARSVSARMLTHLSGRRTGSGRVRLHGTRLRPDLSRGIGPFRTRREARRAETELAADLRRRGFRVHGARRGGRL